MLIFVMVPRLCGVMATSWSLNLRTSTISEVLASTSRGTTEAFGGSPFLVRSCFLPRR